MRHIPSTEINWRNLSDEELLRTVRANESWMGIPLVETLVQRLEVAQNDLEAARAEVRCPCGCEG